MRSTIRSMRCVAIGMVLTCGLSITVRAQGMWVTGYYPYWAMDNMPPQTMNWNGLTHVVHFFARPETTPPYFGPAFDSSDAGEFIWGIDQGHPFGEQSNPDTLVKYAHLHGVKVILSLGGVYGGQAATIDTISQDAARTALWIQTAGAFCRQHGYDGMELDWESPTDTLQVYRIISTMRVELDSWPLRGELLVAIPGWDGDAVLFSTSISMIDQYNIEGYDLQRPSNLCCGDVGPAGVSGFNAALHRADPAMYPIVSAISDNYDGIAADAYVDSSVLVIGADRLRFGPRYCIDSLAWNPRKIGIGVPFYGYMFPDITAPNQFVATADDFYMQYARAADALMKGGTYTFDVATQTPWIGGTATDTIAEPFRFTLYPGQSFYMTYEDTNSIKAKVAWAQNLGLGGMMIYALDEGWNSDSTGDKRDPLLRALVTSVAGGPETSVPPSLRWNLVSIPFQGAPSSPDSLFPGNTFHVMYGYDPGSQSFYTVPPAVPAPGTGYWLIDSSGELAVVAGLRVDSISIPVAAPGWVMIGSVTDTIAAGKVRSDPSGSIVQGTLFGWDARTQTFTPSPPYILPGKAYWVLVDRPCTIWVGPK